MRYGLARIDALCHLASHRDEETKQTDGLILLRRSGIVSARAKALSRGGRVAKFDLKAYARQGAAARVAELNAELAAIYRVFPDLRGDAKASAGGQKRKRRAMTAAQKAEVSKRMKKYWAARRAKKG